MNRLFPLGISVAVFIAGCQPTTLSQTEGTSFGKFEGEVVAAWDLDGRNMTLRETFIYIDSKNRRWVAPAGKVVNGASIPAAFWSLIGGPFEGRYRNASVVHDIGCEEMSQSWEDVHRMFYEACRCGGVDDTQAKMLYYAVYHFGPRWQPVTEQVMELQSTADGSVVETEVTVERMARIDPPPPTPTEIDQMVAYVIEEDPQPEEMKSFSRDCLHCRRRHGQPQEPDGHGRSHAHESVREPRQEQNAFAVESNTSGFAPNPTEAAAEPRIARPQRGPENRDWQSPNRIATPGNGNSDHDQGGLRTGRMPTAITPAEQQWARELVAKYIDAQAGEPRPAIFDVERGRGGYRVSVTFLHADEAGQMVATEGGNCTVRVSRQGEILEFVAGTVENIATAPVNNTLR